MREYVVLLVQPVDARAVRAANAFASTSESAAGASDCPPSAWPQTATMISQASSSAPAGTVWLPPEQPSEDGTEELFGRRPL
jgi:hypothetical protein